MRMQRTYCNWNIENEGGPENQTLHEFLIEEFHCRTELKTPNNMLPTSLYFLNKQKNINIFLSCLSLYVDVIAYIIKCNYLSVTFLIQNYFGY